MPVRTRRHAAAILSVVLPPFLAAPAMATEAIACHDARGGLEVTVKVSLTHEAAGDGVFAVQVTDARRAPERTETWRVERAEVDYRRHRFDIRALPPEDGPPRRAPMAIRARGASAEMRHGEKRIALRCDWSAFD